MHRLHKFLLFHVLTCLACGSEIIHGKKAKENSLLFMASVQNNRGHVCGGFLITEEFVVTAAHCDDSEPTSIVFGTHNLRGANKVRRDIEQRYKHPDFEDVEFGNDIMLLKISRVQLGKNIQPIQLPSSEINLKENQTCCVAGWGKMETRGGRVDELREVNVSIINPQVCKEKWPINLPHNIICAGGYGTNKGFCQGDSGGPLVCNGMAVGVVSFNKAENCTYPDVPNVYTDISKYLPWINKVLKGTEHYG